MAWQSLDRVVVGIAHETAGTECHTLIELHISSYDRCGSNDNSGTVVDHEPFAD